MYFHRVNESSRELGRVHRVSLSVSRSTLRLVPGNGIDSVTRPIFRTLSTGVPTISLL